MRKLFYTAAFTAIVMTSCTEEISDTLTMGPGLAPDGKFYIEVNTGTSGPEVKTVFDPETYEVSWKAEDEIGAVVYDGAEYTLHRFTNTGSGNMFVTDTFTPEDGKDYVWYLLYPYDDGFMVADGKTTSPVVNISTGKQTAAGDAGHVDTPVYGTAESSGVAAPEVVMHHLAAIIKVTVINSTSESMGLSSVSLIADGQARLSGTFSLDFSDGSLEADRSLATAELAVEGVSVEPGEDAVFYIPCAPFETTSPMIASVKADGTGYSSPKTAASYKFKAGGVYPTVIDCNHIAINGSSVPGGRINLTPTVENPAVYAWLGDLSAGELSVVMPEGTVVPSDESFGKKTSYTLSSEHVWTIPSAGQYRVVLDTEKEEVAVYDPATDLKPFTVTWYKDGDKEKYPNGHTTVVENKLWYVGAGAGWNNATGNEILFTPSVADPQILVFAINPDTDTDRRMRGGQTVFSIEAGAEFDAGGGDGVEVFNRSDWFLGSVREDADGDGLDDTPDKNIIIPFGVDKQNVWTDMYGGYDVRESWWNFAFWPDYIVMDLRNMKFLMAERYKW